MGIIKERRKLNKAIRNAKNIFLMAHKNLDLDALGSQIGMYMILKKKKKNCFIIIDDKEHEAGVEKVRQGRFHREQCPTPDERH